jgi:hypothetical protein
MGNGGNKATDGLFLGCFKVRPVARFYGWSPPHGVYSYGGLPGAVLQMD